MKTKAAWLNIAVLLLMSSLAVAETPAAAELATKRAPVTISPLAGVCAKSLVEVFLPDITPPPVPLYIHCGACSDDQCSNGAVGQSCQLGGTRGSCKAVQGSTCGGTPANFLCQCSL